MVFMVFFMVLALGLLCMNGNASVGKHYDGDILTGDEGQDS